MGSATVPLLDVSRSSRGVDCVVLNIERDGESERGDPAGRSEQESKEAPQPAAQSIKRSARLLQPTRAPEGQKGREGPRHGHPHC